MNERKLIMDRKDVERCGGEYEVASGHVHGRTE
jgi:hypothetical protein